METKQNTEKVKVQEAVNYLDSAFTALIGINTYLVDDVKGRIFELASLLGCYSRNL